MAVKVKKYRTDIICPTCRVHTTQQKSKYGWRCVECGTVINNPRPSIMRIGKRKRG